jgi:hypothetical protein
MFSGAAAKAPSDEGAVTEGDWGREKLPLSHAVRMTARYGEPGRRL